MTIQQLKKLVKTSHDRLKKAETTLEVKIAEAQLKFLRFYFEIDREERGMLELEELRRMVKELRADVGIAQGASVTNTRDTSTDVGGKEPPWRQ